MKAASRFSIRVLLGLALSAAACSDGTGIAAPEEVAAQEPVHAVVDTGQDHCYNQLQEMACPSPGAAFFGQDAQHTGAEARYRVNGDGTVSDLNTGLMWTRSPDLSGDGSIDAVDKLTYTEATARAQQLAFAGYDDWRLPTIKELYSLMDFRGKDLSGSMDPDRGRPFLDTSVFDFGYGDVYAGERPIDAQFATSTKYLSTTMGGNETMFGVNFADGRIKGYPIGWTPMNPSGKTFYVLFVRGDTGVGVNDFVDNGDGTVTDRSTGLMWSRDDSGTGMDWKEALAWVQEKNAEAWLGHDDWRLPDAKELQGIVDYGRAPDATSSAAIDPVFHTTSIVNEAGQTDFPAFWSSTTHVNDGPNPGGYAVYVCFGRCMGYMEGQWMDVHGAGAQRSDPKVGDPSDWPYGHGPQGDAIRIDNYVRLVRDAGR